MGLAGASGLVHGRDLVCANDVNLSGHVIEDIIRRWETEDSLRHGPECGSILRPAMAFSIYGATANVHGLIFA